MHPNYICKRTGHRDPKTLFENYYEQSDRMRQSNTLALIGSVEEKKLDLEPVLAEAVRKEIPREVLNQVCENEIPESKA